MVPIQRKGERVQEKANYSRQSIEWLEYLIREKEIFICHAENHVLGEKANKSTTSMATV